MTIARRIAEHRPHVVFGVLVFLSLASLASGTQGGAVGDGLRTAVGVTSVPFLIAVNGFEDGYEHVAGLIFSYGEMRAASRAMQADIAELRQRVAGDEEMRAENDRLRTMLSFQRRHPRFTLMPAEVLQHAGGILTINRGSIHYVRESMCVITPEGVIGLITRVGPLTSNVVTLQSPDFKVDAMVKWSRVRGRVSGSGNDLSALCSMDYIDLKDEVQEGDEIVTSPDSVFPSGYPIGIVEGVPQRRKGQLSKSAGVLPAADPFRVDEVFVLLSASLDWMELADEMASRTPPQSTLGLMDMETIQERLAP